ncbi:MAG: GNAT family N-acetyltransferase [Oscillospiraceae bacterium]|nr:GNAT family N-acetyltransferase [Oscillospiraceae bacterium]
MKVRLETERLILRPFRIEDEEAMYAGWASDPVVTEYLTWCPHASLDVTKEILQKWISEYEKPERLNFAIERKEDSRLMGGIDVVGYLNGPKGTPVIGYVLSQPFWNQGYMTEACTCLLQYLFSLGYTEVRIDAMTENIRSNRVIVKCGGEYLGTEQEERPAKKDTVPVNRYIVRAESFAGSR